MNNIVKILTITIIILTPFIFIIWFILNRKNNFKDFPTQLVKQCSDAGGKLGKSIPICFVPFDSNSIKGVPCSFTDSLGTKTTKNKIQNIGDSTWNGNACIQNQEIIGQPTDKTYIDILKQNWCKENIPNSLSNFKSDNISYCSENTHETCNLLGGPNTGEYCYYSYYGPGK